MTKRLNLLPRLALLAILGTGLGSCSGGVIGIPALSVLNFNFAPGFAGVRLNALLELRFTAEVDPASVNQDSIRIFTTTTTQAEPDPGAPAIGDFMTTGDKVIFLPRIPEMADLSDAGLRIGFTYTVQVPSAPAVIDPVRTVEGDPNLQTFTEFFTTLNQTILPAPGDIIAEPNLASLSNFFIDEGIENGVDPCPREDVLDGSGNVLIPGLPEADRDSPQVIDTDPDEGESGFGTITGIQQGLGTAFVRLDPITIDFSEPVSPWRIRPQNITIRNTNLGGETFDLFFFFTQDRELSRLQVTVFDADSAFDQASVPQGRYVLELTQFTDLAGNPLVNSGNCVADGTFQLSFSTVSSPALPTDLILTFQDDDGEGHVDVGGLATAVNDPNIFPEHMAPFLGGFAIDTVGVPSPSAVTSNANWGNTAFWTGCEVAYDNGFRVDNGFQVPTALRLRGGSFRAATPIMAPVVGLATGRSDPVAGSLDGSVQSAEAGKVDFFLQGAGTATLFTGDATTGPIVYHYNRFDLLEDTVTGARPTLRHRKLIPTDSLYPLIIFVEDEAVITGNIICDGQDGEFGFNGLNDGSPPPRNLGGNGGGGGPGGGNGGAGGANVQGGPDPELHNGQSGGVPANVLGPLDDLSEAVAGLANMVTGGGGHFDVTRTKDTDGDDAADLFPSYSGGGGGGTLGPGTDGGDLDGATTPDWTDQGVGGQRIGTFDFGFGEPGIFATGGAGGGGGAADDDGGGDGTVENGFSDNQDDGGGGAGGGGGFFGLSCGGDICLGEIEDTGVEGDPTDDTFRYATIRCVGGRGGSTYAFITAAVEPALWTDANMDMVVDPGELTADITGQIGQGEAGGGGGGGGICLVSCGQIKFILAELFVQGKLGGNAPSIEAGGRSGADKGGDGGGGKILLADVDGVDQAQEIDDQPIFFVGDSNRDVNQDGMNDFTDPAQIQDLDEMTGAVNVLFTVYGDDDREPKFGATQIITEFFDTLSDSVSYDEVRVLSNAPRFPYMAGTPDMRTIRVIVDAASTGPGGLPDLSTEDPATGNLIPGAPAPDGSPTGGATLEVGLHFNDGIADPAGMAQYDSRFTIPASSSLLGRRFVRVRILFDLSLIGTPAQLLDSFAPPGSAPATIADDPATPEIDNGLGNIDTAPAGVPAVAEARVKFTP